MPLKSVTASDVLTSTAAIIIEAIAASDITQGEIVHTSIPADPLVAPYLDTVDLADASQAAPESTVRGMAINAAAAGQRINIVTKDPELDPGTAVDAGETLALSATTPGGMCPDADLGSGHFKTVLGVGIGGNKMHFAPIAAGIATP